MNQNGTIKAVCISEEKGTVKHAVEEILLVEDYGVSGDAHAGKWHRQVSLLAEEKVDEFRRRGGEAVAGTFGENILTEGVDLAHIPVGSTIYIGDSILEVTQIGKDCHSHCEIYQRTGDCIMPREGIFAVVKKGGVVRPRMSFQIVLPSSDCPLRAAVVTLSDQASQGLREDVSGPTAVRMLEEQGYQIVETIILPDEQAQIERQLKRLADQRQVSLIVTTGGTGFAPRDCTPEATRNIGEKEVPGLSELMRAESMKYTNRAALSRGVSVIRNKSLIINLPGSPKAVTENLEVVLPVIEHGIKTMLGFDKECGRK